jgi:hypothetical protein
MVDYLEELKTGLQAIRNYLDEKAPDWVTVTLKVEIEPCHSRVEMLELVEQTGPASFNVTQFPPLSIKTCDVTMRVGILEALQ